MGNKNSGRKKKEAGQKIRVTSRLEPDAHEKFEMIRKRKGWLESQAIEYFVDYAINNLKEFELWFENRFKE